MSIAVDSISVSSQINNALLKVNTDSTSINLFPNINLRNKQNTALLESFNSDSCKGNSDIYVGLGFGALALFTYWATKGKIKNFLKARQIKLDNELCDFVHGYNRPKSKNISALFKDSTTRRCDVSVKTNEQLEAFVCQFKDKLPLKYIRTGRNGETLIKDCVELEVFEIYSKGKGHGTKKLQEIIKYANEHTEGRLCLMAQQKRGYPSPVLFYYKNGLRSFDDSTNVLLEKILKGEEPMSKLPSMLPMYLP